MGTVSFFNFIFALSIVSSEPKILPILDSTFTDFLIVRDNEFWEYKRVYKFKYIYGKHFLVLRHDQQKIIVHQKDSLRKQNNFLSFSEIVSKSGLKDENFNFLNTGVAWNPSWKKYSKRKQPPPMWISFFLGHHQLKKGDKIGVRFNYLVRTYDLEIQWGELMEKYTSIAYLSTSKNIYRGQIISKIKLSASKENTIKFDTLDFKLNKNYTGKLYLNILPHHRTIYIFPYFNLLKGQKKQSNVKSF